MKLYSILISAIIWLIPIFDASSQSIIESADLSHSLKYHLNIGTPKGRISGILIIKNDSTHLNGTIINEFGFSAIDFTLYRNNNRIKLQHVVKALDKWYIKRVLRNDLKELLTTDFSSGNAGRHYSITISQDTIELTNRRHRISYKIVPFIKPNSQ